MSTRTAASGSRSWSAHQRRNTCRSDSVCSRVAQVCGHGRPQDNMIRRHDVATGRGEGTHASRCVTTYESVPALCTRQKRMSVATHDRAGSGCSARYWAAASSAINELSASHSTARQRAGVLEGVSGWQQMRILLVQLVIEPAEGALALEGL